jgi:hypothetical protein
MGSGPLLACYDELRWAPYGASLEIGVVRFAIFGVRRVCKTAGFW